MTTQKKNLKSHINILKRLMRGQMTNLNDTELFIAGMIREKRKKAGISQGELGRVLGVTYNQIGNYERGLKRISCGKLYEVKNELKCNISDFFPAGE
jgi:DNA-binding transcriptional regulator YiaG